MDKEMDRKKDEKKKALEFLTWGSNDWALCGIDEGWYALFPACDGSPIKKLRILIAQGTIPIYYNTKTKEVEVLKGLEDHGGASYCMEVIRDKCTKIELLGLIRRGGMIGAVLKLHRARRKDDLY